MRPDGEYDVIVLGSNIQLVLLAYAFCKEGKKARDVVYIGTAPRRDDHTRRWRKALVGYGRPPWICDLACNCQVTLIDTNPGYYGGEGASLDVKKFLMKFKPGTLPP